MGAVVECAPPAAWPPVSMAVPVSGGPATRGGGCGGGRRVQLGRDALPATASVRRRAGNHAQRAGGEWRPRGGTGGGSVGRDPRGRCRQGGRQEKKGIKREMAGGKNEAAAAVGGGEEGEETPSPRHPRSRNATHRRPRPVHTQGGEGGGGGVAGVRRWGGGGGVFETRATVGPSSRVSPPPPRAPLGYILHAGGGSGYSRGGARHSRGAAVTSSAGRLVLPLSESAARERLRTLSATLRRAPPSARGATPPATLPSGHHTELGRGPPH